MNPGQSEVKDIDKSCSENKTPRRRLHPPHRTPTPKFIIALYIIFLSSATYLVLQRYAYHGSFFTWRPLLPSPSGTNTIDTGYAQYRGAHSYRNAVSYLGIPYAEPPVGDRRFRAPLALNTTRVSLEAKGVVVDATEYPDFCIQGVTGGAPGGAGSEDCLKVNIYTPPGSKKGSNLPVLVYFHGGGYINGNPRNWPFDHWIDQSPNIIIVSVYYRLSSFGFLATPAFRDTANGDFNAGFLDQIQALKWVKEHIYSFGGDGGKVTINGESAGGSSVELHLVAANGGERLFSQAIAQSVYRTPLPTPEQQEPLFNFYAKRAGCGSGSIAAQLACLRKASVSALARAQDAAVTSAFTASGYKLFHPVVDGKVITDFPTKSVLEGKFAAVPLIVGATTNETAPRATLESFFPSMSRSDVSALLKQYPLSAFADLPELRLQTAMGDSQFRCARSILGTAFASTSKAWTYRYNQRTPGASGVDHAAENWMMFKGTTTGFNGTTTFSKLSPTATAFAEELIAYWVSFVRSGDPNAFKLARSPVWTPFTADEKSRIVLQEGPGESTDVSGSFLELESADEGARCRFVASMVEVQQN
ncbi:hypothetical protein M413DRAFT_447269 [Hebeloma cylindrosporum]|uniref:Carboxylic ester hydrolase n=1 Tax=Hebeloma cylindrosporum TaxID=76867 RepID=A0A0C3BRL4_HEBCY|nr:hypothetical protein M413DRAFT_447269 [Hebeloma cylindrosporum h7]